MDGVTIRYLRNRLGLSQRELAFKVKISHSLISYYESEKLTPNQDTAKRIERYFHWFGMKGDDRILELAFVIKIIEHHTSTREQLFTEFMAYNPIFQVHLSNLTNGDDEIADIIEAVASLFEKIKEGKAYRLYLSVLEDTLNQAKEIHKIE